jgi:acyl carrier protein
MSDLENQINAVFQEVFEDDDLVITPDTTAADIAGWDSLQHVTLILNIEARFKVRFTSAEIADLRTVGELIDIVGTRLRHG